MNINKLKAVALELAKQLANERIGSVKYKNLIADARKQHKSKVVDEDFLDLLIQKAEEYADTIRDDLAARQSLSRVAPLES